MSAFPDPSLPATALAPRGEPLLHAVPPVAHDISRVRSPCPPHSSTGVQRVDAIAAGLGLVAIMVVGSLLSPGTPGASLAAALALAALGLGLVYSVDGFTPGAFSSHGELVRVFAGASAAGGALGLALAWRWPGAFSPLGAVELAAAIVVSGAGASRGVSSRRARSAIARARALVIEGREDGGFLTRDVEQLGGRVDVVGRMKLPAPAGQLKAALDVEGLDLVLVEGSLADIDFELLRRCSERAIRVLVLHCPSYGLAAGARVVRLGGLPWLSLQRLGLAPRHLRAKRALDLGLVLLSAPLVLPVSR